MAILLHGTTRRRAEKILLNGPDPNFVEPDGSGRAEGFSTYLRQGPFLFGTPEQYARFKAAAFPDEGGPAIIEVDVPDEIIALAANESYFPLNQGLVQFDAGAGFAELRAGWASFAKRVISVEDL
jgi:hypothetical protein